MVVSILYPNRRKFSKNAEKQKSSKSFLNLHFKGFGAISRSRACRALKTVHFGIGEVPKAPTDDRFLKVFPVFCNFSRPAGAFFWSFLAFLKPMASRHLSCHPPNGLSPISIPST